MHPRTRHILFWFGVFIYGTVMYSYEGNYFQNAVFSLLYLPCYMLSYYMLRHYQIPKLFHQRKFFLFVLSILISSLILAIGVKYLVVEINKRYFDVCCGLPFMNVPIYLTKLVKFYLPALALLAYESHLQQLQEKDRISALEKEKIATELKYLKAQLNPHFLFNTLNNLYSFILSQSPQAPEMVMRLSEILDYTIYRSQAEYVQLQEEVKLLENYLSLEKIRYGNQLELDFTTMGIAHQKMAPLLFLSLVENAFKHGASGSVRAPKIKINIAADDQSIALEVWNTKPQTIKENQNGGLGLSNIKRRLDLLYPNLYTLDIQDNNHEYRVLLKLMDV